MGKQNKTKQNITLGSATLNRHFFLAGHKWLATDKSPRVQPTASSERNGVQSEGERDGEPSKMHYEGKKGELRSSVPVTLPVCF